MVYRLTSEHSKIKCKVFAYLSALLGYKRMLLKVVKQNGAHELFVILFMNTYVVGLKVILASERCKRDTIRGVQIRAGAVYVYLEHGVTKYSNLIGPLRESISLRITPFSS